MNGIVGLLASGGSTNHTIHLVAIARAAGVRIDWDDFAELSAAVPLLARDLPERQRGHEPLPGSRRRGFLIRELLEAGLLHGDVVTVARAAVSRATRKSRVSTTAARLARRAAREPTTATCCAAWRDPFDASGGLKCSRGNLGRAIDQSVGGRRRQHRVVEAPARVFTTRHDVVRGVQSRRARSRRRVVVVRFRARARTACPSCIGSRRRSACSRIAASASRS